MKAIHAMTKAGHDLFRAEPLCRKADVTWDRLRLPSSSALLTQISCRDCRAALNWPKAMDDIATLKARIREEERS